MPVPVALFKVGGFAFTVYILAYLIVYFWQYFHGEIALIDSLYIFTAPSRDVQDVVQGRRNLDFKFQHWFCCRQQQKRKLYQDASKKKDQELDIKHLTDSWRIANFLGDITDDPEYLRLVKYMNEYRVISQDGSTLPNPKESDEKHDKDMQLSSHLNQNDHVHEVLIKQITGQGAYERKTAQTDSV